MHMVGAQQVNFGQSGFGLINRSELLEYGSCCITQEQCKVRLGASWDVVLSITCARWVKSLPPLK